LRSKTKRVLLINLTFVAVLAFYYFVLSLLRISCPIKAIFNIPCPTCGVTRALICLVKGDIGGYFKYNAFALPLVFAVILELNRFVFKKPIYADVYAIAVAALNFVYYAVVNFIR